MRFLRKSPDSALASGTVRYRDGGHNEWIRDQLVVEQDSFCAYSEARIGPLSSVDVEHFDRRLKGTESDGYLNWYATLHAVNQRKRRREDRHAGAAFFASRFFQAAEGAGRVQYDPVERVFRETDPADAEARALVDYLGFNDEDVFEQRRAHVRRIADLFEQAGWDATDRRLQWLREHPEDVAFPTALAAELRLELEELLTLCRAAR